MMVTVRFAYPLDNAYHALKLISLIIIRLLVNINIQLYMLV